MEPYEEFNILYWYAYVNKEGTISYSLTYRGKREVVCAFTGFQAMEGAFTLCYPVVCLN